MDKVKLRWNLKNLNRGLNPPKPRFKFSAGLNLETFNTILSGINHIKPRLKFKPPLKFFKFGHRRSKFMHSIKLKYT